MTTDVQINAAYDLHALRLEELRQEISRGLVAVVLRLATAGLDTQEDEELRAWFRAEAARVGLLREED